MPSLLDFDWKSKTFVLKEMFSLRIAVGQCICQSDITAVFTKCLLFCIFKGWKEVKCLGGGVKILSDIG